MYKEFDITVDLIKETRMEKFVVNTNDLKTLKFNFTITRDEIPFDITGTTVRIAVRKPDQKTVLQDCTVTVGPLGKCEVILTNQAYLVPSEHKAELMIFRGNTNVATTRPFAYVSRRGIMDDESLESANEFPVLQKAIDAGEILKTVSVEDIKNNVKNIDNVQKQVNKFSPALQEYLIKTYNWELGSVLTGGGLSGSTTRIRTSSMVELKAGTKLSLVNKIDYKYALHRFSYSDKSYLGQTGWVNDPTVILEDVYALLLVAKTNDSNLTGIVDETSSKLEVYGAQSINVIKDKVEKNEQEVVGFKAIYESSQLTSKNMVANGDFKNGMNSWTTVTATATISNGELKLVPTGASGRIFTPLVFNPNDVIYRTGLVKTTSNKVGIGGSSVLFKAHSGSGKYERLSDVRMYNQYYMSVVDTRTEGWDEIFAKNLLAINLTKTFGVGKEPTAKEMDNLLSRFPNGWIESNINNSLLDFKEVYFKLLELNKPKNELDNFVKATAHRGYSSIAPENTLPAYKLAKEKGFSFVECDVIFSADGVGMISHLDDLSVCTNGTGLVSTSTLSYLKTLDAGSWKNTSYAGTQMPTFKEFLILCKRLSLHPYIEIKKATITQVEELYNTVKLLGMKRKVTWIGALEFLRKIIALDDMARVAWVTSGLTDSDISTISSLKTGKNEVFANLDYRSVTQEISNKCLNADIPLEVWTVNDPVMVRNLVEMGVTGITTDGLNIADTLLY